MEQVLISLIDKLNENYIMEILAVIYITYLFKSSKNQLSFYEFKDKVKSKYKKELRNYIRAKMDMIVIESVNKATDIINNTPEPCDGHLCGIHPLDQQLGIYEARLKVTVKTYLTDAIFICIYENGFEHMEEFEREEYYKQTAIHLKSEVDAAMKVYSRHYKDIINNPDERFSMEDATNTYKKIILKFLRLKQMEKAEIDQFKKEHSFFYKIKRFLNIK